MACNFYFLAYGMQFLLSPIHIAFGGIRSVISAGDGENRLEDICFSFKTVGALMYIIEKGR